MVSRIRLHTAIHGRYALVFFNPLALTYACASELLALSRRIREFWSRDVEVLGVTLDAAHQHSIWRNVAVDHLPKLSFPLVVDTRRCICPDYGLSIAGGTFAHRGIFLIDLRGVVRYQAINDLPLGSEIDHALRMVDVLQASYNDSAWTPTIAEVSSRDCGSSPARPVHRLSKPDAFG
jgi:peroxiredoxin (alkyl hydroperoxide reductase subunit C)